MSLPLVYNPNYVSRLPPAHRFPMQKFRLIFEILLREGLAQPEQVYQPDIASVELLAAVHEEQYIRQFISGSLPREAMRRIGLPWSEALVLRTRTAVAGTLLTARLALQHGIACNTAGGTHHAFPDHGSGFCIFNDIAVAAETRLREGAVQRVLIVDLDVHQGDGTAAIFRGRREVFTFSIHCEQNFPFVKQESDLDIALAAGSEDGVYLRALEMHLPELLNEFRPDLVIYDAGVDPHADDRLGKLALSDEGLFRRDRLVLETCVRQGVPVACVVGGGYAQDVNAMAMRHTYVHRAALEMLRAA